MGLVTGDSTSRVELPRYDSPGEEREDGDWQRLERTTSPESSESPRRMDEKLTEDDEREYELQRREWAAREGERGKEWEGHRPPGGPGAFI